MADPDATLHHSTGTDSARGVPVRLDTDPNASVSQSIIELIVAATGGEYDSVAELGSAGTGTACLGRKIADGTLEVLFLPTSGEELYVLDTLDAQVPASAGVCVSCGARPYAWSAACPRCGRAFVGVADASFTLADVQDAAAQAYSVVGAIGQGRRGTVFFARDRHDGRLVALAALRNDTGEGLLEAVWEESADDASAAPPPLPGAESAAMALDYAAPVVRPTPTAWAHATDPLNPPTSRRRWLPAVVVGVLLLAVAAGLVAWRESANRKAAAAVVASAPAVDSVVPDSAARVGVAPGAESAAAAPAVIGSAAGTVAPTPAPRRPRRADRTPVRTPPPAARASAEQTRRACASARR